MKVCRQSEQLFIIFPILGTGPFSSLGGVEGIGYIKTSMADYPEDYPDMELLFIGGSLSSDVGIATYRGTDVSSIDIHIIKLSRLKQNLFSNAQFYFSRA